MYRFNFLLLLVSLTAMAFGQQILTNKDSLNMPLLQYNHPNYYFSVDTLLVYNIGQESLIIDSLISKNAYSYQLEVIGRDTTFFFLVYITLEKFYLQILPGDSAWFIFFDPELCPICDDPEPVYNFEDSLYIYSNSIENSELILYVEGFGLDHIHHENDPVPNGSLLMQNYPNPFNASTRIEIQLIQREQIELCVYNALGQRIKTVFSGSLSAGNHVFIFDAAELPSGVYYAVLRGVMSTQHIKMLLIR